MLKRPFHSYIEVIRIKYYKVKTFLFYGFFFRENGKNNCIINPILITPSFISFGNNVFIRNSGRLEGVYRYDDKEFNPKIILEDNVSIEQNVHITCADSIIIGQNTAIASNVTITDIDHPYEDILLPPEKQPITVTPIIIGKNCKIYNNAVILPGTILGNHNIIAANSVVLKKTYPDYCVLAGAPARIVKKYDFNLEDWRKTNIDGDFIN